MDSQTQPSGTFANRYAIERELGRGGTATVYLATDSETSKPVALKVLHRELAESVAADRFLREFRLNAALRHPHVTPILDSGQFDRDLYLVMPHMEGGSLRLRLEKERQLSVDAVVEVVRSIGSALQHAHERGLIHRDVKPENILFSGDRAYLSDFGIARGMERSTGDSTTSSGIVRGTPAYMSPEQASGDHHLDGRTDQYSFGCVVYEMLAGLPPFHGPTQESTIALRFRHAPREISVYRPSVPRGLERVIEKAMSLAPADRYANMGEFVKAFEAAATGPTRPLRGFPPTPKDRRRWLVMVSLGMAIVASLGVYGGTRWRARGSVSADSTQVVVLPVEVNALNGPLPYEFFHAALRRWADLNVVPLDRTVDALAHQGHGRLSPDAMRSIAISLGARRYVVVGPTRTPTGTAIFAAYRDVESGSLHELQIDLPTDSSRVAGVYAAVADSLVLRGATDGGTPGGVGPRHLFATQAFIRAATAREVWDLDRADSELALAVSLDPGFSRAYLWQAQQRSWEERDAQSWIALAERALQDTAALTPPERLMARALARMGQGQYPEACNDYRTLVHRDSVNFAGWYGLGECNHNDHVVVADPRSKSHWRFRASLQQALSSYVRAFQLIPSTYRGFRQNGYGRLRELLLIGGNQWPGGVSVGTPPVKFSGLPALVGDTMVLVPWPQSEIIGQRVPTTIPLGVVTRLRSVFDNIVGRWANTFPRSSGTKEALAISLEMRGDPAAVDTAELAERLATDPNERTRLLAGRLNLQLKFAAAGLRQDLQQVSTTAESLLAENRRPATPAVAGFLAPVAAMIGRCARAAELLRASDSPRVPGVPIDVEADIAELDGLVSAGCPPRNVWTRLDAISARMTSKEDEYYELNAIVRASLPSDPAWVRRLGAKTARTIRAERFVVEGHLDSARITLIEAAARRKDAPPGQVTADAVVPEARVWLVLHDTANAIASVESALKTAQFALPLIMSDSRYNTARMGFLVQAYALHAELLAMRDPPTARRSARVALTMWRSADPELQVTVTRLRQIEK